MAELHSETIASFTDPPVAEVVTSLRFAPMSPQSFLGIASLWESAWAEQFPRFDLQGPYQVPVESFDKQRFGPPGIEFGFQAMPPLPRVWLTSASGTELLQIQADWFAANWRRDAVPGHPHAPTADYDRWHSRREAFVRNLQVLSDWLRQRGEEVAPVQCEVTYINHIRPIDGVFFSHSDAANVFRGIHPEGGEGCDPEQFAFNAQYVIPREDALPESRLHASVTPAYAGPGPEPSPILIFELTVRGAPSGDGDLLRFFDRGRRAIVQSFVQLTSDDARRAWGQE
ncbi:MAG: TIGR04255 family protein [Actinomycetota bacterium]